MAGERVEFPTMFAPGEEGEDEFVRAAAAWVTSAPVVEAFETMKRHPPRASEDGDPRRTILSLQELCDWLKQGSWFDKRNGLPRYDAEVLEADAGATAIVKLAELLGMRDHHDPSSGPHAAYIALGGARLAPLMRTRWLLRDETGAPRARPRHIVLLGASRLVGTSERPQTDEYAPDAESEFDLMLGAGVREFGLDPERPDEPPDEDLTPSDIHERRRWRTWRLGDSLVHVVQAPTERPSKVANTSESVRFVAEELGFGDGDSLVLSTSAIYVPYQQTEAVRAVGRPLGCRVQTIGHPIVWNKGTTLVNFQNASNYLQEIRSTIQGLLRLLGVRDPEAGR